MPASPGRATVVIRPVDMRLCTGVLWVTSRAHRGQTNWEDRMNRHRLKFFVLVVAALLRAGPLPAAAAEFPSRRPLDVPQPAALRLDQPLDYQVFQRQSATKGQVRVAGRVPPGTDKLEVQIHGAWQPVDFTRDDGTFRAELTVRPGGWYACLVRAMRAGKLLATARVPARRRGRGVRYRRTIELGQLWRGEAEHEDRTGGRLRRDAVASGQRSTARRPRQRGQFRAPVWRCHGGAIQGARRNCCLWRRWDERARVVAKGSQVPQSADGSCLCPPTRRRRVGEQGLSFFDVLRE